MPSFCSFLDCLWWFCCCDHLPNVGKTPVQPTPLFTVLKLLTFSAPTSLSPTKPSGFSFQYLMNNMYFLVSLTYHCLPYPVAKACSTYFLRIFPIFSFLCIVILPQITIISGLAKAQQSLKVHGGWEAEFLNCYVRSLQDLSQGHSRPLHGVCPLRC